MRTPHRRLRGSALVVTMILLVVLTVIGVAAVVLSSAERQNASAKVKLDALTACASAAQAKMWAELARYGAGYLGSGNLVSSVTLPDGTKLTSPSHYDPDYTKTIKDVVLTMADGAGGGVSPGDLTNGGGGVTPIGQTQVVVAHCTDKMNRQYEVELGLRFAL